MPEIAALRCSSFVRGLRVQSHTNTDTGGVRGIVSANSSSNALTLLRYPSPVVQALDDVTSLLESQQPSKKQQQTCEIVGAKRSTESSIRLPRICREPTAMIKGREETRMAPDSKNIPLGS